MSVCFGQQLTGGWLFTITHIAVDRWIVKYQVLARYPLNSFGND